MLLKFTNKNTDSKFSVSLSFIILEHSPLLVENHSLVTPLFTILSINSTKIYWISISCQFPYIPGFKNVLIQTDLQIVEMDGKIVNEKTDKVILVMTVLEKWRNVMGSERASPTMPLRLHLSDIQNTAVQQGIMLQFQWVNKLIYKWSTCDTFTEIPWSLDFYYRRCSKRLYRALRVMGLLV